MVASASLDEAVKLKLAAAAPNMEPEVPEAGEAVSLLEGKAIPEEVQPGVRSRLRRGLQR